MLQHFNSTIVESGFELLYLLLEVVDFISATLPVFFTHPVRTIWSTEFEPLAILWTIQHMIDHEFSLHIVI